VERRSKSAGKMVNLTVTDENLDKMERRSKILGLLALIYYICSGFIFFLHSVGIWSPFDIDWLIALIYFR